MWYYIHHYFDPNFDHLHLKPVADAKGHVNMRNLDYVQNVIEGQVLAEIRPLTEKVHPLPEKRFVMKEPALPAGANTEINPQNPNQLMSSMNGYVFYHEGKIVVKHLLNVRSDIDLHTGNIAFVGDTAVHGDAHSGFELRANNILVKGIVEGAFIKAEGNLACEGGFKGGDCGKIIAGNDIQLAFCETGEIRADHNVVINGSCLHCNLYVGNDLIIHGRLQGGVARVRHKLFVSSKLGSENNISTRIVLGENPFTFRNLQKLKDVQETLKQKIERLETIMARNEELEQEYQTTHKIVSKKLEICTREVNTLKHKLSATFSPSNCLLVVPGTIMPGVEVKMGEATLLITEPQYDVHLRLVGDEITINYPAMPKK